MRSQQMKELCSSPSSFGACPDHNLLDSIAEGDQVSLLPIIRMAFPFLQCGVSQPFPPNEIAFSFLPWQSMTQTHEESNMQIDNGHSLPLSEDARVGPESMRHTLIQNVSENMQMDQPLTSSSITAHVKQDSMPYNFMGTAHAFTDLRQQCMMHGLKSMPCQPRRPSGEACEFSNAEVTYLSRRQELVCAAQRAELEESLILTDDKLSLSLGSTSSETELQMNAASGMTNVLSCTSPESSWSQQQVVSETSEGAAFPPGDLKRKRVPNLSAGNWMDLNSCTMHTSFERNDVHEDEVTKVVERHEDPGEIFAVVGNERTSALVFSGEYEQGSKKGQILPHAEVEDADIAQEKEAMITGKGCTVELNACIRKECVIVTSFSNESPCGSMPGLKGASDDARSAHVSGSTNLDCSIEELTPKRCHRSNGKQWQCRKNATPGTLYCELHHSYMSKCKFKEGGSSGQKPQPYIQREKAKISTSMQMDLQRGSDCCLKRVDAARCRRTDGKLWQCSKQVMPGSIYCENHHNWRTARKKQKANSYVAGKNKPDDGANACSGDSSCKDGHVNGEKELEDTALICSSRNSSEEVRAMQGDYLAARERNLKMKVSEVWGGATCTRGQSHEDGYHRKAMQFVQSGENDGLVSVIDGGKQDITEHASLCIARPEGKKSVNEVGQFTEMGSSEKASQAVKEVLCVESCNTVCSQDTNADSRGNQNRQARQCHRHDGKQWRCSQLCKPGSMYCEHHHGYYLQKLGARGRQQAEVKKLENEETHVKGFARKLDNKRQATSRRHKQVISSAHILHDKQQLRKETKPSTNRCSLDLCSRKQCQRKDGKGWQCSQYVKQGYSYCEHHLIYRSKRKSLNLCRKENRLLAAKDNTSGLVATLCILKQGMSAADEPILGSAVNGLSSCSPSDTLSILKQGKFAVGEEPLLGNAAHSSIQREVLKANINPLEGSLVYPSATFNIHYSEDAASHDEHYSSGMNADTVKVATTPQESSTCSSIVRKSNQKQQAISMGCTGEVNGCVPKECEVENSFCDKSPPGSMLEMKGCLGEPRPFVARRSNSQEKPKPERCHRSNGKQWRCSKFATPGTLYCGLHHAYRSKCKRKLHATPGNKLQSYIQREKFQTSRSVQAKSQRLADCCLEQLNTTRCRRTDGRFWQCSKKAMPGSTYCENHHNRRRKKQKVNSLVVGKNKPDVEEPQTWAVDNGDNTGEADVGDPQMYAVDNGANMGNGNSFSKHGHCTGLKEEETGLDQTLICSSEEGHGRDINLELNVSEVCGRSMPTRAHSHEGGYGAHVDGLVDNMMCSDGLVLHKEQLQEETSQLTDKNSQIVCSSKQCQSKDCRGGQCSQHAKQGHNHCEPHLAYISKCNTLGLNMKEDYVLPTEDNREMSTPNGPSSCRKACPSASPCIPKQEKSAGDEPLLSAAQSSIQKQAMKATNQTLEGSLLYQSATFTTQYSEVASSHGHDHGSQKQATPNVDNIEAATTPQESSTDSSILLESIQEQLVWSMYCRS